MREIKFKRVFKNRNTGEISFMEWGNIDFRGQSVLDFSSFASPGTNSHSSPVTDLQYTGLKDKNGKEIYEGDICEWSGRDGSVKGTTIWEKQACAFWFKWHDGAANRYKELHATSGGDFYMNNYVEIIGNIYEHPHLLTNKLNKTLSGDKK